MNYRYLWHFSRLVFLSYVSYKTIAKCWTAIEQYFDQHKDNYSLKELFTVTVEESAVGRLISTMSQFIIAFSALFLILTQKITFDQSITDFGYGNIEKLLKLNDIVDS